LPSELVVLLTGPEAQDANINILAINKIIFFHSNLLNSNNSKLTQTVVLKNYIKLDVSFEKIDVKESKVC
jgi:hypothetical protein